MYKIELVNAAYKIVETTTGKSVSIRTDGRDKWLRFVEKKHADDFAAALNLGEAARESKGVPVAEPVELSPIQPMQITLGPGPSLTRQKQPQPGFPAVLEGPVPVEEKLPYPLLQLPEVGMVVVPSMDPFWRDRHEPEELLADQFYVIVDVKANGVLLAGPYTNALLTSGLYPNGITILRQSVIPAIFLWVALMGLVGGSMYRFRYVKHMKIKEIV